MRLTPTRYLFTGMDSLGCAQSRHWLRLAPGVTARHRVLYAFMPEGIAREVSKTENQTRNRADTMPSPWRTCQEALKPARRSRGTFSVNCDESSLQIGLRLQPRRYRHRGLRHRSRTAW